MSDSETGSREPSPQLTRDRGRWQPHVRHYKDLNQGNGFTLAARAQTAPLITEQFITREIDGCTVKYAIEVVDGRAAITGAHITNPGGLDSTQMRTLTSASALQEAREAFAERVDHMPAEAAERVRAGEVASLALVPALYSRSRTPDRTLAEIADAYVRHVEAGAHPVMEQVAADVHLSPKAVARHVAEARRRDLLTRTIGGKAGGSLTPKAHRVLGIAA